VRVGGRVRGSGGTGVWMVGPLGARRLRRKGMGEGRRDETRRGETGLTPSRFDATLFRAFDGANLKARILAGS